tara:strand:+ start:1262 stop:1426 length:165 start_codon:yes stop_codon:yes gene_type:complete
MIGRHILFPEEIWEDLKAIAKLTGNSPSALVRQFVVDGVARTLHHANKEVNNGK